MNSPGIPDSYDLDFRYFGAVNMTVTSNRLEAYICPSDLSNCRSAPFSMGLPEVYAARSRHPGGVNVAMADGSVHFIKNSISIQTWRGMSTAAGAEVFGGGESY